VPIDRRAPAPLSSSTRRVLKSIVGPALGGSLAAMLATTPVVAVMASGCAKEVPTEPMPPVGMQPMVYIPDASPIPPPTAPPSDEPTRPVVAPEAGAMHPIPVPGMPPRPGTIRQPDEPTPIKVGIRMAPPEHSELRPTRPSRRATDPEATALRAGLVGVATRKLV
jgi:hypothetical protein